MAQKIFTPIVLFNDLAPSSSSSTSSSIRHNASSDIPAAHVLPSTPHLRINSNSSSSSSTETRTELQRHTKTGEQDPQEQDRVADGHYKDYGHLGPSLQDTHMDVDEVYMDESDPGYVRLQASTTTIIEDKDDDDESRTKNPTNSSSYESHQERGLQELEDMSRSRSRIGVHAESVLKHTEDHNNHDNSNNNNSNSNNNNNNNNSTTTDNETSSTSFISSSPSTVSLPSSYSSNTSPSMDALARTLAPARGVDMHRKRIQRMLQQNSLLWWELVRYTRNLERREREQEQEQEQRLSSSSSASQLAAITKSGAVSHYHHHYHHYNPSLPPLHPQQQQTLALSKSLPLIQSTRSYTRLHPYEHSIEIASSTGRSDSSRFRTGVEVPSTYEDMSSSSHFDRGEYLEDPRIHDRRAGGAGYSPTSHTPSPSLSPSPMRPSQDMFPSPQYPYEQTQHQHHQHQSAPHLSQHGRHYSQDTCPSRSMEEYSRQSSSRTGSRYEQGSANSTKLPSMDSLLPSSTLKPGGIHSSGSSSAGSSPRSREPPSISGLGYSKQHQHQQQNSQSRDAHYQGSPFPPSPHDPEVSGLHRSNSQRTIHSSPSRTEFVPHQHPKHQSHPQLQHQHQHQYQQQLFSRPPHALDTLPRPVPVKPASFVSPGSSAHTAGTDTADAPSSTYHSSNNNSNSDNHKTSATAAISATSTSTTRDLSPSANNNNNNNNNNTSQSSGGLDPNRKRRGNLPKSVTSVLKSWLVQNAIHPYPTEEEKMRLSNATQLSMNQISNWFINARRRILQPILVEAAAAAVAGTDAPVENVLIVRKGKGSRMQVEMEAVSTASSLTAAGSGAGANVNVNANTAANANANSNAGSSNMGGVHISNATTMTTTS